MSKNQRHLCSVVQEVAPYYVALLNSGFEKLDYTGHRVFWKEINQNGRHVTIATVGGTDMQTPDWKTKFAKISVYRGIGLCENLVHEEIAYTMDDLTEFLRELWEGTFDDS